ncbi:uncharacterized protein LOC130015701 [Mercurialis annua]|uniref:uncharacterized protein LOC130015701 n=1 Tax=Mercurialis annua TaxID=3986 RepID=UPI0024ADE766|nr:uncharacterized protein LOC130015701 [Mercurialis annua]
MDSADFVNASSVTATINSIPMLSGSNFKTWKNKVTMVLGCMDLDLALREPCPTPLMDLSSSDELKKFERWDRSNRVSLMIMKNTIPETFLDTMSEEIDAKKFLDTLEERFTKSDKADTSASLRKLVSMRYKGNGSIREYILEMFHLSGKLKTLKIEISEDLLVHLVLISLPPQFGQFEVSYNCQKDKWTFNELISHLVQEEERMKQYKTESAHFVSTSSSRGKKRKEKEIAVSGPPKKQKGPSVGHQEKKCFFCKDPSHMKKDCAKYHTWRVKKGLPELPKT